MGERTRRDIGRACLPRLTDRSLAAETPIKVMATLLWSVFVYPRISKVVYRPLPNLFSLLVDKAETAYLYGFGALQLCMWSFASSRRPENQGSSADVAVNPNRRQRRSFSAVPDGRGCIGSPRTDVVRLRHPECERHLPRCERCRASQAGRRSEHGVPPADADEHVLRPRHLLELAQTELGLPHDLAGPFEMHGMA